MKHIQTFESFLTESALNESTISQFKPTVLDRSNTLDEKFFKKLMPRTAGTTDEAMERIWDFEGNTMFAHYQYFVVKPNGNRPDRPTYRIHNSQYWLNDTQLKMQGRDPKEKVNVTLLTFYDVTDAANEKRLGSIWVDTTAYLDEQKRVFEMIKSAS
jgi:hypothetical protein